MQLVPVLQSSMDYPKYSKGHPLRPIVSSRASVTYGVAKELTRILKSLVGKSAHHINNSQDFTEHTKNITLGTVECITSYDVPALYTSVPVEPAIDIIQCRLEQDTGL